MVRPDAAACSRTAAASRTGSLTVNTAAGSGTGTRPDAAAWSAYRRAWRTEQPNRRASTRAASAAGTPASASSAAALIRSACSPPPARSRPAMPLTYYQKCRAGRVTRPDLRSLDPAPWRVTISGVRECAGCGQRLPRPLPGAGRPMAYCSPACRQRAYRRPRRPRIGHHRGPAPPARTARPRRRLTARPRRHAPAGQSPRTPRPLQPPVTQRDVKAEVIHCVGGVVSPLMANIALSALDDHFDQEWRRHMPTVYKRAKRRQDGKANYKMIRYADDFVVMVSGDRHHAEELQEEVAAVLAPLGLRLAPEKTAVVHIDEGFDFLGYVERTVMPM